MRTCACGNHDDHCIGVLWEQQHLSSGACTYMLLLKKAQGPTHGML